RFAEWLQCFDCLLRHHPQRRRKFSVLNAVAFQFRVLERGERFGLLFRFKKAPLSFSGLAVIDDEFQVRTIAIPILANPDFALSHVITVGTLLAQKQVKSRYYRFLCVTIKEARKGHFS